MDGNRNKELNNLANEPLPENSEHSFPEDVEQIGVSELLVKSVGGLYVGEKDKDKYPEGGKGWLVVAGTFLVLFCTHGNVNAYGIYQDYYEEVYPTTKPSVISLIGSLQPTLIYSTSLPVVGIINLLGVNYAVLVGSLIMVFAIMMTSLQTALWQAFLAQGILYSFGAGITFFAALMAPSEWFKERRALAVGITVSGASLGGVIWSVALQKLIAGVGFGWANRILAFIFLPLLLFSSYSIQSRLPQVKQQIFPTWSVCRDWRFMLLGLSWGVGIFGLFPPLFYISAYSSGLGVRPDISIYVLAILNALSIIGRILPPHLGDKIGRLNVLILGVFLCGVLQYGLWYPASGTLLIIAFSVVWGAASGIYISVYPSVIPQIFGMKDNRSRLVIFLLCGVPGCMAGPSLAGLLIKGTGAEGYNNMAWFTGTTMVVSSVLLLILRLSISTKLRVFL